MIEIWKDVVGYEGRYQISNFGRVKSLGRYSLHSGIWIDRELVMSCRISKNGYPYVNFYNLECRKTFKVHRLVAQAFIPNSQDKLQINHKDGNKQNNRIDNLEWVTAKENINHFLYALDSFGWREKKKISSSKQYRKNGVFAIKEV